MIGFKVGTPSPVGLNRYGRNYYASSGEEHLPLFLLVAASATPVGAEESGKWRGRAVLVVTSEKASEVADKKDHKVRMVEYDGVVFTEVGSDFLANVPTRAGDTPPGRKPRRVITR